MKTKFKLTCLLIVTITFQATAQYFEWANNLIAIPKGRTINDMSSNSSGNMVSCGYLGCGMACVNAFVWKINSDGTIIYNFGFSASGAFTLTASANSVATDYSGNAYVSGSVNGYPTAIGNLTANSYDFIFKLDAVGNVVWLKNNLSGKLAADSAGNLFLVNNTYTRKYDSAGNIMWSRTTLQNADIVTDPSGRILIFNSDSIKKFNTNGTLIYSKPTGGVCAGNRNSNAYIINSNSLTKLDVNGNPIWSKPSITGNGVAIDKSNGIYIINDTAVQKINSTGTSVVWTRLSEYVPFGFIGVDSSKNVFLAGNYDASFHALVCPFNFLYISASSPYSPQQCFNTKINVHGPQPFQALVSAGFFSSPFLCNLTPFIISDFSYCLGGSSNFEPTNEFKVQLSDDGFVSNIYDIGTVNSAFIPASVPEGNFYRLRVISTDPPPTSVVWNTSSLSLDYLQVYDKSMSISPVGSPTRCAGDSVQLTAPLHTGNYHWFRNNIEQIQGSGLNNYFAKQTGTYYCVFNGPNCDSTSNSINVIINAKPNAAITPQGPTTFCAGGSVVLSANTGANLSYKWKKNNMYIAGTTLINYTATTAGNYRVEVTNNNGCTKLSPAVTVTVPCRESSFFREQNSQNLILYPSPVSDILNIELPNWNAAAEIKIYNSTGQLVKSEKIVLSDAEIKMSFDIKDYTGGIYSVIVRGNEKVVIGKFLKE